MRLFSFLLGVAAGAFGLHYYYTLHPESSPGAELTSYDRAKAATQEKIEDLHLTGPEIKDELDKTGKLVRTKATAAGHKISEAVSNARIISVINAKYTLDKDLSVRSLNVDCDKGVVTLTGTVHSAALLSKAVAIALDTDGVTQVSSYLVVQTQTNAP